MARKVCVYKGFGIFETTETEKEYHDNFIVYTKDEMEQPKDFRYAEIETSSIEVAKQFIDSY